MSFSVTAIVGQSVNFSQVDRDDLDTSKVIQDDFGVTFAKNFAFSGDNSSGNINRAFYVSTSIPSGETLSYVFNSGLTRTVFNELLPNSFNNIKAIVVQNLHVGFSGDILVSATGSGFTEPFGGSTGLAIISPDSAWSAVNHISGWNIDETNGTLQFTDVHNVNPGIKISVVVISGEG